MSGNWQNGNGDDGLLDGLFAEAAAERPRPGAALAARVLADAARETQRRRAPSRGWGWVAALGGLFGGSGGLAGLVSATLVGVWIGWSAPAPLQAMVPAWAGEETVASVELIPDFTGLLDGEDGG